jgi:hypothetical protein
MKTLSAYLKRSFPLATNPKKRVLIAFSFSTTIYLFLLLFKPFNIISMKVYIPMPAYLLGYWVTTFCSFLLFDFILPQLFKKYCIPDAWTLGKTIVKVTLLISTVGFLNFLYDLYLSILLIDNFNPSFNVIIKWFIRFELYTFAVGVMPGIILLMLIERILKYRNQNIAEELTEKVYSHQSTQGCGKISIPSNNKNESLSLYKKQLLCIKAEGNYANVFYLDAEQVKSKLIRNTLTNIISRIEDEDIKRCQISYIINFDKVKRAHGNAKNIKLQIEELDFDIAVSRKFPIKDIYKFK